MPNNQKTNSNRSRSWTKCSTQFCCGWIFDWRITKGDTIVLNAAVHALSRKTHAKNGKKQWNVDSITTQLEDVFKEIFPCLPEAAQEKILSSFPGLVQTPEPSKPTFLSISRPRHA